MAIRFAGNTPLLNLFKDGAVVVLRSRAGGKHLRIMDGEVQGTGGTGKYAQFTVDVRGKEVVALQSVADPKLYVRIRDDKLDIGSGGPWCDFRLSEHDGHVVFESVKTPGQHIGVKPNSETKPPQNTGTGEHAQFYPTIVSERTEHILAGSAGYLRKLAQGNIVCLKASSSGKNIRRMPNGEINGEGGTGELAQWIVHVRGPSIIALQNVKDPEAYLSIQQDKLQGGHAGHFCEFKVEEHNGHLTFESVRHPGQHVGIRPNGDAKPPNETGTGQHAQFAAEVIKQQPVYNRAGDSNNMRCLNHMNNVVLYSRASGKTIRIQDGKVNGTGGEGRLAQFTVQVRAPGVVALRNVNDPNLYLDPTDGDELGTCWGDHKAELKVTENDDHLVFESTLKPGWHVGILPSGEAKPPKNTGTGQHAQFTPKVTDHWDHIY